MPDHPAAPEQRTVDVDVSALRAEGNTVRGHAAVFNTLSEDLGGYRERIAAGAFRDVLDADVRLLVNHKPDHVLARTKSGTLRLTEDGHGLAVEADLPDTSYARDLRESMRRGDLDGMSFRFGIGEEDWSHEDGVQVRTVKTVAHLEDVCLATYPAYPAASVELRTRPNPQEDEVKIEDRNSGGLAVEDRTVAPNVEQRVVEAVRSIRKGESRAPSLRAPVRGLTLRVHACATVLPRLPPGAQQLPFPNRSHFPRVTRLSRSSGLVRCLPRVLRGSRPR